MSALDDHEESKRKMQIRGTWAAMYLALGVGLLCIIGFGVANPESSTAISLFLALAAAAFGSAGLLGFLFGVPRRATGESAQLSLVYLPNTNLEQVSDWLTKLLLGATLTQIGNLTQWFGDLFAAIGGAIGGTAATAFAGVLTVYFASAGFIGGWLATRLYLGRLMVEADESMRNLLQVADEVEATGNVELAAEIRAAADTPAGGRSLPSSWRSMAARYETIRSTQPSSVTRTSSISEIFKMGTREAADAGESLNKRLVVEMFETGTPGARIMALSYMDARTDLVDVSVLIRAITEPRSAFEQYHALKVALQHLRSDDPIDSGSRLALSQAIDEILASGSLDKASDRRSLANLIRDLIRGQ